MDTRAVGGETPNTVNPSVVRTRRYLTGRKVESTGRPQAQMADLGQRSHRPDAG